MNEKRNVYPAFKVRLRLHYSWIAVLILMTAAVVTQFSTSYPFLQRLVLGIIASGLFLLTTVLRMFIITLIAVRKGAVIKSDTIFAVGGVLEIDENNTSPALEVLLAIIGFLINLVIAGILFTTYQVMAFTGSIMVHVFLQWLAFIYFMISLMDLLPGLPLDGGRVLRVILWKITKNYYRITRIVSWIGWAIGIAMTITGIVLTISTQQWFMGILLALPGLILQNAATHQRHQAGKPKNSQGQTEETKVSPVPG